ncbi:MAG TPA: hypothetical protein PK625_02145 [Spirochaetales bacterium]|nr:hypothetical protein [Spirochaetales bacterium]
MKKPLFMAAAACLLAVVPALAQPFGLGDLVVSTYDGIPTPALHEPFPWGLSPDEGALMRVPAEADIVRQTITEYQSADPGRPASVFNTVYTAGKAQGSWLLDGVPFIWTEGDTRHFFVSSEEGSFMVSWKGPWHNPSFVRKIDSQARSVETWTRSTGNPESWVHSSTYGQTETWTRSESNGVRTWTMSSAGGSPGATLVVRMAKDASVAALEWLERDGAQSMSLGLEFHEGGATIAGRSRSGDLRVEFSESLRPLSESWAFSGNVSLHTQYATDTQGRVTECIHNILGRIFKSSYQRDELGRVVAVSEMVSESVSGQTRWVLSRSTSTVYEDDTPGWTRPQIASTEHIRAFIKEAEGWNR